MSKVRLETSNGELVVHGDVPPFVTPPDVLVWGTRVFQLYESECEGAAVYRECFAVYLTITTPPPVADATAED